MPVPKKKTTKSAKNQRRSHHGLKKPTLSKCTNCKEVIAPHHVCPHCGQYKGKEVLDLQTKEEKKLAEKEKAKKNKKEDNPSADSSKSTKEKSKKSKEKPKK